MGQGQTALAPITSNPDNLGPLRVQLAALGRRGSRSEGERIAEALIAAGIEISDDDGSYLEADDVLPSLGGPKFGTAEFGFVEGYWQAMEQHAAPDEVPKHMRDGAQYLWSIYYGLARAIECHQWREFAGVPSDMVGGTV